MLSGSLALLADASHMQTDAAALALTYGFFQVLAAYSNELILFFIALAIAYETFQRLRAPREVLGEPMLAVALVGLLVKVAAFLVLRGRIARA